MEEKKFKIITAIDRINYFSDNFIAYYKKWFRNDEFYFMVHKTNYSIIKNYLLSNGFLETNMERYDITSFGEGHNVINQNRIKSKFLNEDYIVLYADMDERIYHPDLRRYIEESEKNYIIPQGLQIIETNENTSLDVTKNVIEQRSCCVLDTKWYSKVCILKKDFEWHHGRHNKPDRYEVDRNVYLVDIGKMCKNFMVENNKKSSEIYQKVMWRYKETNKTNIQREVYDKIVHQVVKIPEIIKQANPF